MAIQHLKFDEYDGGHALLIYLSNLTAACSYCTSRSPGETVCSDSWQHHRNPKKMSTTASRKLGYKLQEAGTPALQPVHSQLQCDLLHKALKCFSVQQGSQGLELCFMDLDDPHTYNQA